MVPMILVPGTGSGKLMLNAVWIWEVEVVDFNTPYRVSVPAGRRCEVILGEMEEVKKFKYLGTVLYKHGRRNKSCERQVCHKITCNGYNKIKWGTHATAARSRGRSSPVTLAFEPVVEINLLSRDTEPL